MKTLAILLLLTTIVPTLRADEPALSRRERKDRIAKLSEAHRQFLLDVEPIMIDTERDTFLRMETDAQREMSDPEIFGDRQRAAAAGRNYRQLETAVKLAEAWRRAVDDEAGAREAIEQDRYGTYLAQIRERHGPRAEAVV